MIIFQVCNWNDEVIGSFDADRYGWVIDDGILRVHTAGTASHVYAAGFWASIHVADDD